MKTLTVVTPTFNEADNVEELVARIRAALEPLTGYRYEILFVDNASTDDTVARVKALGAEDPRIKLIVNIRNFGHIRSPYHGLLQARGDAVLYLASDLQDPPELLPEFIARWEAGYKVVMATKTESQETPLFYALRSLYYAVIDRMAAVKLTRHTTGFGLYDQEVIEWLRRIDDPYPYARGLVAELGYPIAQVPFKQPQRKRGITKNNFYTLYDLAMLGFTNHSKVPLRLATMLGFALAALCLLVSFTYLVLKLVFWNWFPSVGQAPTVVGLFFIGSVQLIFTGILGEYIGAIHTQVQKRPLVVEKERFNFPVAEPLPAMKEPQ